MFPTGSPSPTSSATPEVFAVYWRQRGFDGDTPEQKPDE
jgi:hypothetical protein